MYLSGRVGNEKEILLWNHISENIFMAAIEERICIGNPDNKSEYNQVKSNKKSRRNGKN